MSKYIWKLKSLAKGIDPNDAVKELERIETLYGALTPENILEASSPEDTVLHRLFIWDNEEAGRQYRLQQARTILNNIEVVVVSDGSSRQIPVYEVVTREDGRVYKPITEFNPDDIKEIRNAAIREFNYWKNKLSIYNDFESVVNKLDDIIDELGQ